MRPSRPSPGPAGTGPARSRSASCRRRLRPTRRAVAYAIGRRVGTAVERNRDPAPAPRRGRRLHADELVPGGAYLFGADRAVLTVAVRRPRVPRSRARSRGAAEVTLVTAPPHRRAAAAGATSPSARLLMLPIRGWRLISVHLPPRCRFHPSCSQYALDALDPPRRRRGAAGSPSGASAAATRGTTAASTPSREPNVRSSRVRSADVTEES